MDIDNIFEGDDADDQAAAIYSSFPLVWWEEFGKIQDKAGSLITPQGNYLQERLTEVWDYCQEAKRPFRVLVLKPRQKGSSTYSTALLYHYLSSRSANGYIIGGAHDQGSNLIKMVGRYADYDTFFQERNPVTVLDKSARWQSGSRLLQGTARNPEAGRSGTFQFVLGTEVARWAEEGVSNAAEVLSGLLKCVPSTMPEAGDTAVILESTARGASGDFYDRWNNAIDFDDFKSGKDGYIKVFAPWHVFKDSVVTFFSDEHKKEFEATMEPEEKDYWTRWGLTLEQMAWRRKVIEEECQRDPEIFEQDYPITAESAFLTSGRRRFSKRGLTWLRDQSRAYKAEHGLLVQRSTRKGTEIPLPSDPVSWQDEPDPWTAQCTRWERPTPGYSYIVTLDQAKGASDSVGADPDSHGAQCWRAGLYDGGIWKPPKLVARLGCMGRNGMECRWDADILSYETWKLAEYYGGAMIAVEDNFDRGIIENLKSRGAYLYRRETFNRVEQAKRHQYGWNTNSQTRGILVETIAKAIREYDIEGSGLEVLDPWTIEELFAFVVKPNGRAEATDGSHDDQVIALGIALVLMGSAKRMAAPRMTFPKENDIIWDGDAAEDFRERSRRGTYS